MEEYAKIHKQFIGYNVFKALDFGIMFLLLALLTRTLSEEQFGLYSILNISIMLLISVLSLGVPEYITEKLAGVLRHKKEATIRLLLGGYLLYIVIVCFLAWAAKSLLVDALGFSGLQAVATIAIGIVATGLIVQVMQSYYRAEQKIVSAKIIESFFASLWALPVIAGLLLFGISDVTEVFLIRLAFLIPVGMIVIFLMRKLIVLRGSVYNLRPLLNAAMFGVPLSAVSISRWVITSSDRYALGLMSGAGEVAFYSIVYAILAMIGTMAGSIGLTIGPYFLAEYNKNEREKSLLLLEKILKYEAMILVPGIVGFFMLGKEILTMVSGVRYEGAVVLIPFLMVFPFFDLIKDVYANVLLVEEKTMLIAGVYVGGVIANIALNLALVHYFNGVGAALATSLTYIGLFIAFYLLSGRKISLSSKNLKLRQIVLASLLMTAVLLFLHPTTLFTKVLAISVAMITYGIGLLLFGAFTKEEKKLFFSLRSLKRVL